jgi:ADP-heptose:LPS heptosyltransferase
VALHVIQRGPGLAARDPSFGTLSGSDDVLQAARLVRALDLVITIDSMPAHLAGALGVPVWTLLPHDADWRWMDDRGDSPWYPTMRLFRQPAPGAWAPLVARVATALGQHAAQHAVHHLESRAVRGTSL